MIDYSKLDISGGWIIFFTAIVGGLIIASGVLIGTKKSEYDASVENQTIIDSLKMDLKDETDKLSKEQKRNAIILDKISILQDKIDRVSSTTNTVVGLVKNEQRGSGRIAFRENSFSNYKLELASNSFGFSKKEMINGFTLDHGGILITIYIENNEFLISTDFKDEKGDILFEINKGNWHLRKFSYFLNYDATGLEIVDSNKNVYLQIELEKNIFKVKGAFFLKDKGVYFVNDEKSKMIDFKDKSIGKKLKENYSYLERNFKHGDISLLGERSESFYKNREAKVLLAKEKNEAKIRYLNLPAKDVVVEAEKFIQWFENSIEKYNKNDIQEFSGIYDEYQSEIKEKLILLRSIMKKDFENYDSKNNFKIDENYYVIFMPVGSEYMNYIIEDIKLLLNNYISVHDLN